MSLPTLAILAGGLATRLRPITETLPKILVPVNGEPFVAHQLRLARAQGFSRVVLCVGHLAEQVADFLAGHDPGLEVTLSHEGDARRGTGGALRHALPLLGEHFVTLYGDSYLDIAARPIHDAFLAAQQPALMTVLHNRDRWDPSNVIFDGRLVRVHDKTMRGQPGVEWIDFGFSVFTAAVVADWPEADPWDLSALTGSLARTGRLAGHEVTQRFYEIGKPEGLAETEAYLRARKDEAGLA